MKLECSSQVLARQQSSSWIQSGFPALASAMNETPKKIPYGGELCILCRKSFLVAEEKINVSGKTAFDISSLVKRATNVDLSVEAKRSSRSTLMISCLSLCRVRKARHLPCIKLTKLAKKSIVILTAMSLFVWKDCQKIPGAHWMRKEVSILAVPVRLPTKKNYKAAAKSL